MSGTVETELRKLEKIVPGLLKTEEKMEMVSFVGRIEFVNVNVNENVNLDPNESNFYHQIQDEISGGDP